MAERGIGEDLGHQRLGRICLSEMVVVEENDDGAFKLAQARRKDRKKRACRQIAGVAAILGQKRLQRIDEGKKKSGLIHMLGIKRGPAETDTFLLQQLVPLRRKRGLAVTGRRHDCRQPTQPGALKLPQQVVALDGLLSA